MVTVGIFGGGQLGCMMAEAIAARGGSAALYDADPQVPARAQSSFVSGAWHDEARVRAFANGCDVLTYEMEHLDLDVLRPYAEKLRPGLRTLEITQHRMREKRFCRDLGFPQVRWAEAHGQAELRAVARDFGYPFVLKSALGGYDGKGHHRITSETALDEVIGRLQGAVGDSFACVLEELVDIVYEASVIVARRRESDKISEIVFPVMENQHHDHILDFTIFPGRMGAEHAAEMRDLGLRAARALEVEGLLTTELFLVRDPLGRERVLVNEFAPRPHNSGHVTRVACSTSQFDALARTLLGHELASPTVVADGAFVMGQLLGDLFLARGRDALAVEVVAAFPEVRELRLYGKREARPGRKMGHFIVHAEDATSALAIARQLRRALVSGDKTRSPGSA